MEFWFVQLHDRPEDDTVEVVFDADLLAESLVDQETDSLIVFRRGADRYGASDP